MTGETWQTMKQWSDEDRDKLIRMWNDGASSGMLGREFGVSPSAIIGKITRMRAQGIELRSELGTQRATRLGGITTRPEPRQTKIRPPVVFYSPKTTRDTVAGSLERQPPAKLPENPFTVAWDDLAPNGCKYSIGDAALFCGAPVHDRKPFCEKCRQRAYQKPIGRLRA